MGTYYSLVNDTKKESVHLDYHVKAGPIRFNKAVHFAFVNYMFENLGDSFRLIPDTGSYDECDDYKEIDLLGYKFVDGETMKEIVADLNLIYANGSYGIKDGIGYDDRHLTQRAPDRLRARAIFSLAKYLVGLGYRLAYYGGR
ncbi:MAG: hypothetical protein HXY38_16100 [Chloroflexi bacterium]|nr:hypothetical protein [Chloroflexota bacterium]